MDLRRILQFRTRNIPVVLKNLESLVIDIEQVIAVISRVERPPLTDLNVSIVEKIIGRYKYTDDSLVVHIFEDRSRLFYKDPRNIRREIIQIKPYDFKMIHSNIKLNIRFIVNDDDEVAELISVVDGVEYQAIKFE